MLSCRPPGRRVVKQKVIVKPHGNAYYEGESANVSYLIEDLMQGYDKRLRPNYKGTVRQRAQQSQQNHAMIRIIRKIY